MAHEKQTGVDVTPAMKKEGVHALAGYNPEVDSAFETVAEVYQAMETERHRDPHEVEVTLRWGMLTAEQTRKVYKARELLAEVGVTFDSDINPNGSICCWEFDWSLKGPLKVIFQRFAPKT